MKLTVFLLLTFTPHFRAEILSTAEEIAEEFVENGPTKILKPVQMIYDKVLSFPQNLEEAINIHQNMIEESYEKNTDLNLNSSSWLRFVPDLNRTYPSTVDWRKLGAVTSVKSQFTCSSDWAFSAVGAIEGQHFRKNNKLEDLSVQQVLDCSKNFNNDGCGGGFIHETFEYVKSAGGLANEESYPYQGQDGDCKFTPKQAAVKIRGYVYIEKGNEEALQAAVASVGPIAVALGIQPTPLFLEYKGGVYFDPGCGKEASDLTLGALVVGYGQELDGQKYWLIKGSYGTKWGIRGFLKLARGRGNHCGVATYASFPLI